MVLFTITLLFMSYILFSFFFSLFTVKLAKIDFLTSSTFHRGELIDCVLFKSETLVKSSSKGEFDFLLEEGTRVKPLQKLATITKLDGGGYNLTAPVSGLVSTKVDQLEEVLQEDNFDYLDMDKLKDMESIRKESDIVEKGEAVIKIIDNLSPLKIYCSVPNDEIKGLEAGNDLTLIWKGLVPKNGYELIEMTNEEIRLVGKLIWLNHLEDNTELLVEISSYPDELVLSRGTQMLLSKERLTGFVIPSSALKEEGVSNSKKYSIYGLKKGKVISYNVEVIGKMKNQYLITGENLSMDTRYVKNIRWIQVGDKLE